MDIKAFTEEFQRQYDFLYEHIGQEVAGYDEAIKEFDRMATISRLMADFNKYRQDFISSDREAAAFMFTVEKML